MTVITFPKIPFVKCFGQALMPRKAVPAEALVDLRRRLFTLPPRSPERRRVMHETAELYGVSEYTLYRALRQYRQPHALQRADKGVGIRSHDAHA
jgi:hypothetical protein